MARILVVLANSGALATALRLVVVVTSAGPFVACLSQVAFFYGLTDGVPGSYSQGTLDLLLYGWMAFPFALLLLFINPLTWAAGVLYEWQHRKAALVVGLSAVGLMWFYGALGVVAWFANPAICFSWFYYLSWTVQKSFVSAAVAFVLVLSFLRIDRVPFGVNGDLVAILSHGTGYWLWVASAAIMVLATGSHSLATAFRR